MPLLLGTNRDEPKLFVAGRDRTMDDATLLSSVRQTLFGGSSKPGTGDAQQEARRQLAESRRLIGVFKGTRAGSHTPDTEENVDIFDAISAETWHANCRRLAAAHASASDGTAGTFVYLFTHESPARRGLLGSAHALEMPFVFGSFNDSGRAAGEAAMPEVIADAATSRFAGAGAEVDRLGREMRAAWLSFARSGVPAEGWGRYDAEARPTMVFGTAQSGVEQDPLGSERAAMESAVGR